MWGGDCLEALGTMARRGSGGFGADQNQGKGRKKKKIAMVVENLQPRHLQRNARSWESRPDCFKVLRMV